MSPKLQSWAFLCLWWQQARVFVGAIKREHVKKQKQLKATESGSDNVDHSNWVTNKNPINTHVNLD